MENKLNFGKSTSGIIKLPPGFRFQPTDKEIVFQYLARKIFSCLLPTSIIPEINVCKFDPWDLPGDLEQDKYFFSIKEAKYRNGDRVNRTTGSGYWKSTGIDKQITCSSTGKQIMGMKKTLVFYKGKHPNACRTDWIMYEYRLVRSQLSTVASNDVQQHMEKYSTAQNSVVQICNWVVCHIFFRKRSVMDKDDETVDDACKDGRVLKSTSSNVGVGQPRFYDFMRRELIDLGHSTSSSSSSSFSSSSSSDSSVITELSSTGFDREEINQLL